VIIGLLPILSIYKDIFNIAEVATILLIAFSPFVLLRMVNKNKITISTGKILLLFFLLDAGASVFIWGTYSANNHRTAILTYMIMVYCFIVHILIGTGTLFNRKIAMLTVQRISILNTAIIVLQYIAHYLFNVYFNPTITNLLIDDAQVYTSYLSSGMSFGVFRPAGLFLEPSHFTLFSAIALWSILFAYNPKKKQIMYAIIISLGIVLTTSGMGIVLNFLMWGAFFIKRRNISKKIIFNVLVGIIVFAISITVLYQFNFFQYAIYRMFTGDIRTSALYTRIYNMQYLENMSSKWLGEGFMNFPETIVGYSNGAVKLIYGQGIIGAILFITILFIQFIRTNYSGKILALCLLGLFFVAEMYSTVYLLFYLMFLFSVPIKHLKSQI